MSIVEKIRLPHHGRMPPLDGATTWLNSGPLTAAALRGHVVLIDFGTYTCINWLRTLPYIRAWAGKYAEQGLIMLGVQTPEFPFERDIDNVRQAVAHRGIEYPVAIDNDYAIWRAFDNHYWPALYFADAHGVLRDRHFGEGRYAESERVIQHLLSAAGVQGLDRGLVSVDGDGDEAPAAWDDVKSPETYLGDERGETFAFAGRLAASGRPARYAIPDRLPLNHWALSGQWTIRGDRVALDEPGGGIAFRFHARDVNLVLAPSTLGMAVPYRVLLDGRPPGSAHGVDVNEHGDGTATEQRMYQLIRQPGAVSERTFEITFSAIPIEAFVFTFG
jgi:Thioredoxin like C-terminal domain